MRGRLGLLRKVAALVLLICWLLGRGGKGGLVEGLVVDGWHESVLRCLLLLLLHHVLHIDYLNICRIV